MHLKSTRAHILEQHAEQHQPRQWKTTTAAGNFPKAHLVQRPLAFYGKRREESAFQNSSINIHWGVKGQTWIMSLKTMIP